MNLLVRYSIGGSYCETRAIRRDMVAMCLTKGSVCEYTARYIHDLDVFLPPATKLGQGNIFRSVFQEFCPWGARAWQGACMAGGMHGRGHAWWGACMVGGCAWQGGVCSGGHAWQGACVVRGVHGRYYEIQSMSGQYASYWNAFLSFQLFGGH